MDKITRFTLLGLVLLAFALRLHGLGRASLWYDELLQLDIAQGPVAHILPQLERHAAMPLDYFITAGWIRLGRGEAWVRFPALLFGTLSIPLIYALGAALFNRRVGVLAALLMTWASFGIRYSQEVRPYALLMTLTLVGYLGLWRAYQTGRHHHWRLAIAGFAGAIFSHYFALFLLLPVGLFVAWQQLLHRREKGYWRHSALFGLLLAISLGLLVLRGRPDIVYWVGRRFVLDLRQPVTLTRPAVEKPNRGSGPPLTRSFFRNKIIAPLSAWEAVPLFWYNSFWLIAVASSLRPRATGRSGLLLLLSWAALPASLIYLFLLARGTFFASRYILYILPPYLLLVARGLEVTASLIARQLARPTPSTLRLPALGVGLGLLLLPLIHAEAGELRPYYTAPAYENWRAVGQLLRDNAWENDAVIAVRAEPAINWYYPAARAPIDRYSRSEAIWEAMADHNRRWFVLSSYSYKWDQGLRDWLRNHKAAIITIDRRIKVYFHQEGLSGPDHLALVQTFALPQTALTHAALGDQFRAADNLEAAQTFYQRAIALAQTETERAEYQARLAQVQRRIVAR